MLLRNLRKKRMEPARQGIERGARKMRKTPGGVLRCREIENISLERRDKPGRVQGVKRGRLHEQAHSTKLVLDCTLRCGCYVEEDSLAFSTETIGGK